MWLSGAGDVIVYLFLRGECKINQEKSENFPSEIIVDHAEVNQKLKEK